MVHWYNIKIDKIREAPIDDRPRLLRRLYRISGRSKHLGVTIDSAGIINPVSYTAYPPKLEFPKYDDESKDEEVLICDIPPGSLHALSKPYNQLDYFKKVVRAYKGRDEDADKYIKKAKAIIDKPLNKIELGHVRLAMTEVKCPRKCPRKLDISVFYQLTGRLPHEDLNCDDERILMHFYSSFCNESIKLLGKMV